MKRSRSSPGSPDWGPHSALHLSGVPYDTSVSSVTSSASRGAASWTGLGLVGVGGSSENSGPSYPQQQDLLLNGFVFPHRFSPPPGSPSPPPTATYTDAQLYNAQFHHGLNIKNEPHSSSFMQGSSRLSGLTSMSGEPSLAEPPPQGSSSVKTCSHCKATQTPLWRRDPTSHLPLCNACGLYLQQRNRLRPQELIDADGDDGSADESEDDVNYTGPECSHCKTHRTSVWRRSKEGRQLCNACGVYVRLRGKDRPLELRKKKIKPRSKHPKPPAGGA